MFEDDDRPFDSSPADFALLAHGRSVTAQRHGLYAVLDLHALPARRTTLAAQRHSQGCVSWGVPHFQDRVVRLWHALAEHYRGTPTVARVHIINEPADDGGHGQAVLRPGYPGHP